MMRRASTKGTPSVARTAARSSAASSATKGCHEILTSHDLFGLAPAPGPRLLGYARVSTGGQDATLQREALVAAGCHAIWTETASGAAASRPVLDSMLAEARRGDTVVVWSLDRLARSLRQLLETASALEARGVELRVLTQSIDTASPAGRLTFAILGAVAEFERSILRERTSAGMASARAQGLHVGRRPALTPAQRAHAVDLRAAGKTPSEIGRVLGVSRETIRRHLVREDVAS